MVIRKGRNVQRGDRSPKPSRGGTRRKEGKDKKLPGHARPRN